MREGLPLHAHRRRGEGFIVEIFARASHAAQECRGPDFLADGEKERGFLALDRELGAAQHRGVDLERLAREGERGEVQVEELVPARCEYLAQARRVKVEKRRLPIRVAQRIEMVRAPP